MHIYESAENYLEMVLMLKERLGAVRAIDIVNEMEYTKASVSIAMKKLRESGYVDTDADGLITLKATGEEIAKRIYERHQLLTQFLMRLGVDEKTATDDACKMEHDISEKTFEQIKLYVQEQERL